MARESGMKISSLSQKIFFLSLLLTIISVGFLLISNSAKYFTYDFWDRYESLKNAYGSSQYVMKDPEGWIPDEVVNAYAGASYVAEGVSPVIIAADTPPLGRYLIGLSAVLTGNENMFIIISGIGSLIVMYLLGKIIFKSSFFALMPVFLLSLEPIFRNQFKYVPLLDIMQLFFLLLAFLFFIKGIEKKITTRRIVVFFSLASLFLGMFISTKFYATGVTIVAAWYAVLLWNREYKRMLYLTLTLPISIFVLLLNYVQLLFQGYSFREFLGVQKYIFEYHKSQLIKPFTIWPLLLLNQWHVWWGNKPILSESQWLITWPILTINMVILFVVYLLRKVPRSKYLEPLLFWSIIYMLFFSFGQITARYLVILIPVMYILFFYTIKVFLKRKKGAQS